MNDASGTNPTTKKCGWGRKILILLLVLVFGVTVILAFLPGILSGGWGKGRITETINNAIAGSVTIDSLSLAWFSGQKLEGVTLTDPQGKTVASIESVAVDASLWSLLWGGRDLGTIAVDQPVLDVEADDQGRTDLQKAVEPTRPTPEQPEQAQDPIALPVTFNLVLTGGKITAAKPGLDPVTFDDLNIDISATDLANNGLTFDLRTTTRQAELSGNVAVAGKVTGFNAAGEIDPAEAGIEATADVTDLPVDGIDTLAGLDGLLTAAIGDRLTLKLITQPGENKQQTLTANAKSAHLNVNLNGEMADGNATADGTVNFTLTPALVRKLAGETQTTLAGNVPINITLESLKAPVGAFDPAAVAAKLKAEIADGSINQPGKLGQLTWRNTTATIDTANLAQLLTIDATSDFTHSGKQGQLIVDADLSNAFSEAGQPQPNKTAIDADVRVTNLPTQLLDTLAGQGGLLVDALGESMNITAASVSEGAQRISITANVTSPRLEASLPLLVTDRIALKPGEQGTATLEVAPELLARYLKETDFDVTVGEPVTLTITQLNAPRPAEGEPFIQPADTTLALDVQARKINAYATDERSQIGMLSIPTATLTLAGDKLDKPTITGDLRLASTGGMVHQYVSRNLMAKLTADTTLDARMKPGPIKVVLEGNSVLRDGRDPLQSAKLTGTLAGDFATFTLDQPATARYIVTDAVLAAEPGAATLAEPMPVDITVNELTTPISGFALSGVKTKLAAAIDRAVLAGNEQIAGTTMTGATADVTLDGPANTLAFNAEAKTKLPNQPQTGGLNVAGNLSNWLDAEAKPAVADATGKVTAKVTDLPAAFVDALAKQDGLVTEALGESINVNLTYDAAQTGSRSIALDAKSPRLTASAAFDIAEGQPLTATGPVSLDWRMTPSVYAKLMADQENPNAPLPVELARPVQVNATLSKLIAPPLAYFTAEQGAKPALDASKLAAVGNVTLSQVALKHVASGSVASADSLKINIDGQSLEQLTTTATGQFKFVDAKAPDQPATGNLDAKATLADLFAEAGLSIDADVKLTELPVAFIDAAQDLDGMAVAALGERLNLQLTTKLQQGNGPLSVALRSNNTTADLVGRLRDDAFTLTQPLVAEMTVTEALGQKLLMKINPIFEGAKTADKPLRLTIPEKDLFIPLSDFSIADLKVPQAQLELGDRNEETGQYDLGAIKLDTGNILGGLIRLAQRFGGLEGTSDKELSLQFTPIVVKLENGRIDYLRRVDVLLDRSFHIASWGYVQLDTTPDDNVDQSKVRTYVGILGKTLDNAFGLDGIAADEMFTIPINGTTSQPKADYAAAAADMGVLQAQYRLLRGQPLLAAAARQAIKKILDKEAVPAPQPSVDPLPWTIEREPDEPKQQADQNQQQNDQQDQQDPKPQKEESLEEQLIKEGLKQIFR